jgi:hypothetical protein
MNEPDFYLASAESHGFEEPRRAWRLKRLRSDSRDDLLLIRVEPPIRTRSGQDLETVIVATRHKESSLFPVDKWPVFIHVAEPLVAQSDLLEAVRSDEFRSIAWAELYRTEQEARDKAI